MSIARTWYLLLRISWPRLLAGFVLVLSMILLTSGGRTAAERSASRAGYWEGLTSRLADLMLWEKAALWSAAVIALATIFGLGCYHFADWADSVSRRVGQNSKHFTK